MGRKYASHEKDLHLPEDLRIGQYGKAGKAPAEETSEKEMKSKGETEGLEIAELNKQIPSLKEQPKIIELMRKLKALEEGAKEGDIGRLREMDKKSKERCQPDK